MSYDEEDERTEEDKIIEIINIEGDGALYEDSDFIPNRQSLYENEGFVPYYDADVASLIVWRRPHDIANYPVYFSESYGYPSVTQGTLSDEVFIGVLMAVCTYDDSELIENIIYSRPDDFKTYGVFTCRFYVEGEWVEVITDTRIPCLMDEEDDRVLPVYSRSPVRKEMWVCLVEKAYAKALGSYEAISKVKIHEALLHLTGGSVQELRFTEDQLGDQHKLAAFWARLKQLLSQRTLILARPTDMECNRNGEDDAEAGGNKDEPENYEGIIPDRLYTVVAYKEVGMNELVLLRCPWELEDKRIEWEGDWSESSSKWDEYPDMLAAVQDDPNIKWRRNNPRGFMWVAYKDFMKLFQAIFVCKLFRGDSSHCHYYCAKGEWRDKQAGGPMLSIRDRGEGVKLAMKEEMRSLQKATAAVIVDGDASWFNNPQYKVVPSANAVLNISLCPVNVGSDDPDSADPSPNTLPMVSINVVRINSTMDMNHPSVGDSLMCNVIANEKQEGVHRQKAQEASIWNLRVQGNATYFIVPSTARRGQRCGYVLRVFSSEPLTLERVPPRIIRTTTGEWTKSSAMDSTGGPPLLALQSEDKAAAATMVENSKWCQNPQYHLKVTDDSERDNLYIKIVVRRTDKVSQNTRSTAASEHTKDAFIGLVVCKPEIQEEVKSHGSKVGKPRLNPFGEVIECKASSLKKPQSRSSSRRPQTAPKPNDEERKVTRKIALNPLYYSQTTTFNSRTEASVFFPKLPRAWMPDGLLLIPCLSERGVRGIFELEVYANCRVSLEQLPETRSRSIAGEWVENLCGGSHICPTYKKNPRFQLDLIPPSAPSKGSKEPFPTRIGVRISLSKTGSSWRSQCRKDAVGCMVGFYVFIVSRSENGPESLRQIYESPFAPTEEVSTDIGFELEFLPASTDTYIIMPTTFDEGKVGSFVLSVSADCDFTLTRDTPASTHK